MLCNFKYSKNIRRVKHVLVVRRSSQNLLLLTLSNYIICSSIKITLTHFLASKFNDLLSIWLVKSFM